MIETGPASVSNKEMNAPAAGRGLSVSVIVPTLNGARDIWEILERLRKQIRRPDEIIIVDSGSTDGTVEICSSAADVTLIEISGSDYDHGGTRHMALGKSKGDIVVFTSQDAIPADGNFLVNLIRPLENPGVAVCTGRQIPRDDASPSERLFRSFRYPPESQMSTLDDVQRRGRSLLASDACCAYRKDIYIRLGGFDQPVRSNEDMLYAARALLNGYSIAYAADARVYHSHELGIYKQYRRYRDQGYEIQRHKDLLGRLRIRGEGVRLASKVIASLAGEGRYLQAAGFCAECGVRLAGRLTGEAEAILTGMNNNTSSENKMKVLVTGAGGQLGSEICRILSSRGHRVIATDTAENLPEVAGAAEYIRMDITDACEVRSVISHTGPEALIHCAAWTDVDGAENPSVKDKVYAVNAEGTETLAQAAAKCGALFLYISTDYVFSGRGETPWEPDDDSYAPLNWYGQTKLAGEKAVAALDRFFIVRTSWLYGRGENNFVQTMMRLGRKHDSIRVVCDQIGTPTYAADLARLVSDMIETDKYGYYHASGEGGYISWYDFACEIMMQTGSSCRVVPVTTEEYGMSIAARPRNSRLDKSKLTEAGFMPLPHWKDSLAEYLKVPAPADNPEPAALTDLHDSKAFDL